MGRTTEIVIAAVVAPVMAITGLVGVWLLEEHPCWAVMDPTGRYEALVTTRTYQNITVAMPGQGSDGPGAIEIVDRRTGKSLGKVALETRLYAHDLRWAPPGARIPLVAEWNFASGKVWVP